MIKSSEQISFYVDTMIVETICADPALIKKAGGSLISSLIEKAKNYFETEFAKGDPNDKTGTMINLIGPTAISLLLSSLGMPWVGFLFGLASYIFDFDIASVLRTIYNTLKPSITEDAEISPTQVDNAVESAIKSQSPQLAANASDNKDHIQILRDARVIKLALIQYSEGKFNKNAQPIGMMATIGAKLFPIIKAVLSWIFKIALGTGGFMLLSGGIKDALNPPTDSQTPTSTTGAKGGSGAGAAAAIASRSKQTKFKLNPSYSNVKFSGITTQNYINNINGITKMVLDFAKEVYSGLEGLESVIESTAGFKGVVETIVWENHTAAGDPIVIIPAVFKSKKDIVDYFIDEVAAKTP